VKWPCTASGGICVILEGLKFIIKISTSRLKRTINAKDAGVDQVLEYGH